MIKYTEAMSSIIFTMHYRVKPKYLGHSEDENLDLMYELAEKATPMKPKNKFLDQPVRYTNWYCPRCGEQHKNLYPLNYCSNCGQRIDWSDYNHHKKEPYIVWKCKTLQNWKYLMSTDLHD